MLSSILAPEAEDDIIALREYLFSQYAEESFFGMLQKIEKTISLLCEFPEMGEKQVHENIRKFPIPKTKIVLIFRVQKDTLQIIRIFHSSQKWERD